MSEMYLVSWKIDVEANNPIEAAEMAQDIMQGNPFDNDIVDWEYEVTSWATKEKVTVDLELEHLEHD